MTTVADDQLAESPSAVARDKRNEARLKLARSLLTHALGSRATDVSSLIDTAAREADVADEWAAEVFWELVRMRFLSPRGGPGPRFHRESE